MVNKREYQTRDQGEGADEEDLHHGLKLHFISPFQHTMKCSTGVLLAAVAQFISQ